VGQKLNIVAFLFDLRLGKGNSSSVSAGKGGFTENACCAKQLTVTIEKR
jgi:hypothetical protein